jgi:uncharacterized membrane protein YeaQ/YmgE (transglycosylase-associated protein family)
MPIDLIIQLLSGAAGGNLAGTVLKNLNMGWLWNSILGIVGGGLTGQILGPMLGMAGAAAKSGMDPMAILGSVLQGGVGGGVLMAVVGVLKGMMANK